MDFDARTIALGLARGRVVVGIVASLLPRLATGAAPGAFGPRVGPLGRMLGARDLALGAGAVTSIKEKTHDAEWVGMGAIVDIADGVALLATRRLPVRARFIGIGALGAGVLGLFLARKVADERTVIDDEEMLGV